MCWNRFEGTIRLFENPDENADYGLSISVVGQEVGWNMSFVEQLGPDANEKYVSNLQTYQRRQEEMKSHKKNDEV